MVNTPVIAEFSPFRVSYIPPAHPYSSIFLLATTVTWDIIAFECANQKGQMKDRMEEMEQWNRR